VTPPSSSAPALDLDWLVSRAAQVLGVDAASLDPGAPLFEYGLDSVAALELAAELRALAGRDVPDTLLYEHPSLVAVLAYLRGGPATAAADPLADARLPADIAPGPGAFRSGPPRALLVTGATGFLGAFTVAELLRRGDARLVCLVRGGDPARLARSLARRGLRADLARLEVLAGDLRAPRLGLDEATWSRLARELDGVVHLAADVDWVAPYAALRAAHVDGTRELLRLACAQRPKAFHLCSSLAVLYARGAPRVLDESADPLGHAHGLDLGYATGKAVSEALVREAGRRGLAVTITRPALIAGDARHGRANPGDFLSALIKGCIELGAAPDLDWALDAVPVDHVAAALADLACAGAREQRVLHLASPRPRPWREVLLWLALHGHDLALLEYDAWLARVESAAAPGALTPFLAFLRARPTGPAGPALPQLYEEPRRAHADARASRAWLAARGLACPAPDAALLALWTSGLERAGYLPAPVGRRDAPPDATGERAAQRAFVERHLGAPAAAPEPLCGSSVLAELGAWRFGAASGLSRWRAGDARLVLKARQTDVELEAVLARLFALCGADLGRAWHAHGRESGLAGAHLREPALYADAGLGPHRPRCVATHTDPARGRHWLLLEDLGGLELLDAVERVDAWTEEHLAAALDGLAAIHAAHLGRTAALERAQWIGTPPSPARLARLAPLWRALAEHAAPRFARWTALDPRPAVDALLGCAPAGTPRTLIHGDFNPRNLAFRRAGGGLTVVAYDWELATLAVPQRDLVELLAFVDPPDPERWVEHHRVALERAAGARLDADTWRADTHRARLAFFVTRLAAYSVVDRVRPQAHLARTVRGLARQLGGR
jgi:thioester reductase-like protein